MGEGSASGGWSGVGRGPGAAGLLVAGFLLLGGGAVVARTFSVHCVPDVSCVTLRELRAGAPLPEAIHIFDRSGGTLAEVAGPLRTALDFHRIPPRLVEAFVMVEDRRFWEHGGVDARGVFRAAVRNVRSGGVEEGASTIPMQLVRTLWGESLRQVGPWRRKAIEAVMGPRLVRQLGRERVLELYVNAIYMGNGLYGVERAARHYFGTGVDSLDLGQTATLVGMTQSPEGYEPRRHPGRARARRDVVLRLLADGGMVPTEQAEAAMLEPLRLAPETPPIPGRDYVSAAVLRELRSVARDAAGRSGLRIFTTIDPTVQEHGQLALSKQLDGIEHGAYGRATPRSPDAERLQGAAVALEPRTGAVLAWIGGRDFAQSEFDRVEQSRRQVGSLVKPLLLVAALKQGYGILDPVSSDTVPIMTANGAWLPDDHVTETVLPLREALVRSSNRAAVNLGVGVGLDVVREVGRSVGITSPIPLLPSTLIGAFDASLLEMTGAFAVFDNGGLAVRPYLIERIEARSGEVLWSRSYTAGVRVVDEITSFAVLDAMRDVVDHGTGYPVRASGFYGPAAGKTGTTNEGRDAWFIGLTPDLVAGVWIGYDQPAPIVPGGSGGMLSAPAWARWMSGVDRTLGRSGRSWLPPPGLERVRYDTGTGEVLGAGCSSASPPRTREAWVPAGRYEIRTCRRGIRGFFEGLWGSIVPRRMEPIEPRRSRRRPGGL